MAPGGADLNNLGLKEADFASHQFRNLRQQSVKRSVLCLVIATETSSGTRLFDYYMCVSQASTTH